MLPQHTIVTQIGSRVNSYVVKMIKFLGVDARSDRYALTCNFSLKISK